MGQTGAAIPSNEAKYLDLLARYYVLKRQHVLAAHVLLRLAERRSTDAKDAPTLDQRYAINFSTFLIYYISKFSTDFVFFSGANNAWFTIVTCLGGRN